MADHANRARKILLAAFDDEDSKVRDDSAACFRVLNPEDFAREFSLAKAFISSRAYGGENWAFLNALEDAKTDTTELVISAAERSTDLISEGKPQMTPKGDFSALTPLVQAAYEGTRNDASLRTRLLNVFDRMLEQNVGGIEDVLRAHDRV